MRSDPFHVCFRSLFRLRRRRFLAGLGFLRLLPGRRLRWRNRRAVGHRLPAPVACLIHHILLLHIYKLHPCWRLALQRADAASVVACCPDAQLPSTAAELERRGSCPSQVASSIASLIHHKPCPLVPGPATSFAKFVRLCLISLLWLERMECDLILCEGADGASMVDLVCLGRLRRHTTELLTQQQLFDPSSTDQVH